MSVAYLLMAMLVFLGTSSQALASLFCQSSSCAKKAVAVAPPKSCCAEKHQKRAPEPSKKSCCCKIQEAPVANVEPTKLVGPALIVLDLPFSLIANVEQILSARAEDIPFSGDLPPPDPSPNTHHGRAPPLA